MNNDDVNTLFIATRHDSHAKYVIDGLRGGKNVYVEKPLCLNIEELNEIEKLCVGLTRSLRTLKGMAVLMEQANLRS